MKRTRHTFRLPPELADQLADYATRKRVSQAAVVEAALASFLSPDSSERMEAAFSRRLDRISRQLDKLDYHVEVGNEAIERAEAYEERPAVDHRIGEPGALERAGQAIRGWFGGDDPAKQLPVPTDAPPATPAPQP